MVCSRCLVLGLLFTTIVPLAASAQRRHGDEQEDPVRAEARRHFEAGVALMSVENWEPALLEFERSLEIFPTRSALFNFGMCQKGLFRYIEAMRTFEEYVERYSEESTSAEMVRLNQSIEELQLLLGDIRVTVNVSGAIITVDGDDAGSAPLAEPVQVVSGRHTVAVRLDGYNPAEQEVVVTSGEHLTVAFDLVEIPHVGTLRVEANVAEAEVWVDGQSMGAVPYQGSVAEGSHDVRVTAPDYDPQTQTVVIAMGERRIVTMTLVEPSGTDAAWFWSMVGVTGAGAVATIALGSVVLVKDEQYNNTAYPSDAQYDEGKNLQLATDICLGVTLAAAVAAGVLAFTTDWGGDQESPPEGEGGGTALGAMFGPTADGVTLGVVGRF
jgi:hypothetical protein